MKFGSMFAGIGGIDLGLERAGMTCAAATGSTVMLPCTVTPSTVSMPRDTAVGASVSDPSTTVGAAVSMPRTEDGF